mmetsp:Transcript_31792/g.65482  ORF Transcript_31792/g.65482 Transcript_31792/m.65482 type:complete len:82 (+) Transcript_31792:103-348(+)
MPDFVTIAEAPFAPNCDMTSPVPCSTSRNPEITPPPLFLSTNQIKRQVKLSSPTEAAIPNQQPTSPSLTSLRHSHLALARA